MNDATTRRARLIFELRSPTSDQKEAYARLLHTLVVACVVGAVTVAFSGHEPEVAFRVLMLVALGGVLFVVAAPLANGD